MKKEASQPCGGRLTEEDRRRILAEIAEADYIVNTLEQLAPKEND